MLPASSRKRQKKRFAIWKNVEALDRLHNPGCYILYNPHKCKKRDEKIFFRAVLKMHMNFGSYVF